MLDVDVVTERLRDITAKYVAGKRKKRLSDKLAEYL